MGPGGLSGCLSAPLLSLEPHEGHGSPSRRVPGCGDGWTVCPVLTAPEQPALPAFPGVPGLWLQEAHPSPGAAWTGPPDPDLIPLAVTGVLRVGAGPGASQLGPLHPAGPGHGLSALTWEARVGSLLFSS